MHFEALRGIPKVGHTILIQYFCSQMAHNPKLPLGVVAVSLKCSRQDTQSDWRWQALTGAALAGLPAALLSSGHTAVTERAE